VSPRIKQSVTFSSTADAAAAQKFYDRCTEVFGGGCAVTVRKADAARRVPRGQTSELNPAPGDPDMRRSERFPSKYVQAADLPAQGVTVVIDHLKMEEVGQEKHRKPVLYFRDKKKGLVVNSTNDQLIGELLGSDDDREWKGERICLYPTTTPFKGEMVACIRVRAADKVIERDAAEEEDEDPAPKPKKKSKPLPSKDEVDNSDLDDEIPW
jgi:hypothetical protein